MHVDEGGVEAEAFGEGAMKYYSCAETVCVFVGDYEGIFFGGCTGRLLAFRSTGAQRECQVSYHRRMKSLAARIRAAGAGHIIPPSSLLLASGVEYPEAGAPAFTILAGLGLVLGGDRFIVEYTRGGGGTEIRCGNVRLHGLALCCATMLTDTLIRTIGEDLSG